MSGSLLGDWVSRSLQKLAPGKKSLWASECGLSAYGLARGGRSRLAARVLHIETCLKGQPLIALIPSPLGFPC
jgi:hypothetical protein